MITDLFLLDSGPLGLATNPKDSPDSARCKALLRSTLASGARVMIPEVVAYELRRELLRAGKSRGVAQLDALAARIGTLPVDSRVWRLAAELWAQARRDGRPNTKDTALDIDVILSAVALAAVEDGQDVVVVTSNVSHLGRFVDARDWRDLAAGIA